MAPQLISDGDSVLCAGLALGSQIEMLNRLANRVVSVDVPRKESRSRRELFQSDAVTDFRPLTRAGDVTAVLRPDENFDCVVVDAAALLGFDLPLDTLALCEALRRRQETPPTVLVRSSALATLAGRLAAGDDLTRIARILHMHDERPSLDETRIYEAQPVIVGARGVREYRNCIGAWSARRRILELGSFGTTTASSLMRSVPAMRWGLTLGPQSSRRQGQHPTRFHGRRRVGRGRSGEAWPLGCRICGRRRPFRRGRYFGRPRPRAIARRGPGTARRSAQIKVPAEAREEPHAVAAPRKRVGP